jgi:hypothetical protein
MKWLKDGLSIDETKVSALIVAFFITLAFGLYQVGNAGDISANLLMLLAYELAAFTGIKVAENFTQSPNLKPTAVDTKKNDMPSSTNLP